MTATAASITPAFDDEEKVVRIAAGGSAVILSIPADGLPRVLHWGADPGILNAAELRDLNVTTQRGVSSSALDQPWPLTVLPTETDGWAGRPGFLAEAGDELLVLDWQEFSLDLRQSGLIYTPSVSSPSSAEPSAATAPSTPVCP